jgi:hypothetical protein
MEKSVHYEVNRFGVDMEVFSPFSKNGFVLHGSEYGGHFVSWEIQHIRMVGAEFVGNGP